MALNPALTNLAIVLTQITKKNDLSILKYVEPAALGSADEGKSVTITVMEYDMNQLRQLLKNQFMGVAMMVVMHFYFKYTNPLLIQSILPVKSALESNLAKIHIFGLYPTGDLKRPWKSANSLFGMASSDVKTSKKSIKEAEKSHRGGVKEE